MIFGQFLALINLFVYRFIYLLIIYTPVYLNIDILLQYLYIFWIRFSL